MESSSSTREGLLLQTGLNYWQLSVATQIARFISYLDQIINYKRIMKNDTQIGVPPMASTMPSGLLPPGGFIVTKGTHVGGVIRQLLDSAAIRSYPSNKITNGSHPDNNPKTVFGSKKIPLEVVPPSAIHALAEAFSNGAKRYGAYNWREKHVSSSVYYGAALRHLTAWWDGEDVAEDSGYNHLHHALACIAILVDGKSVGKLNDNRPPKGAASQMQKDWVNDES